MLYNVFKYPAILLIMVMICFSACKQVDLSKPPDNGEVYNYFLSQLKQTSKASGYLKYRLVIDKLVQDTVAGNCTTKDHENVKCFTLTINRTEYLDNYTGTYISTFIGDTYHLYRNRYGKLDMADHVAGSVNTRQVHHPDMSQTL